MGAGGISAALFMRRFRCSAQAWCFQLSPACGLAAACNLPFRNFWTPSPALLFCMQPAMSDRADTTRWFCYRVISTCLRARCNILLPRLWRIPTTDNMAALRSGWLLPVCNIIRRCLPRLQRLRCGFWFVDWFILPGDASGLPPRAVLGRGRRAVLRWLTCMAPYPAHLEDGDVSGGFITSLQKKAKAEAALPRGRYAPLPRARCAKRLRCMPARDAGLPRAPGTPRGRTLPTERGDVAFACGIRRRHLRRLPGQNAGRRLPRRPHYACSSSPVLLPWMAACRCGDKRFATCSVYRRNVDCSGNMPGVVCGCLPCIGRCCTGRPLVLRDFCPVAVCCSAGYLITLLLVSAVYVSPLWDILPSLLLCGTWFCGFRCVLQGTCLCCCCCTCIHAAVAAAVVGKTIPARIHGAWTPLLLYQYNANACCSPPLCCRSPPPSLSCYCAMPPLPLPPLFIRSSIGGFCL